jgi:hypothetical protein
VAGNRYPEISHDTRCFEAESHLNNNSVRTAKKTAHNHYKDHWLMLFREVITVYFQNHTKSINLRAQNAELLDVKAGGTVTTGT